MFAIGIPIGITPAHAGKSFGIIWAILRGKDHPRTRGEKRIEGFLDFLYLGSPPHTRGKEKLIEQNLLITRITPAHAGKRLRQLLR